MHVRRRAAGVGALLTALVACTATSDNDATPSTPRASSPSATASASSAAPTSTQPLVLAYDIHRPALDLTEARARALIDGDSTTWSQLGLSGGPVLVRDGGDALALAEQDPRVLAVVPAASVGPTVQVASVDGIDPLREPGRYALTTLPADPVADVTTMTIAGDIMLGRRVGASGQAGRTLQPLARRLSRSDLTVGNLESTLSTDGKPQQGDESFAASPGVLDDLDAAGFDLLSLANNHTGDYGNRAIRETLQRIDDTTIARVGAGRDEAEAWRPTVLESHGVRFGFVAFNAIGETPRATSTRPGAAEVRMQPRTGPLDSGDLRRLTRTIRDLAARVDVVVALPHWGTQYTNIPVRDQRRVGTAMVDAGADLVVGGHPHWVQGVQLHDDVPIVHSLGNFVFDMDFSRQTEEGVLAETVFWGDRLKSLRFVPYVIGDDFAPRLDDGPRARRTLTRMWTASDPPYALTR